MATSDNKASGKFGAAGFGILALSCAAFAAFLVKQMIQARGLEREKTLPVVVTTRAISAGEPLSRDALRVAIYLESNVPAGAVREIEPLFKDGKPRIAATGITAGEPLIASRLADAALGTAMAARVQSGYRGVPVKVDNAVARAGLLYPGARVDVVGTMRNKSYIPSSRVAIQNVRVLSVEARIDVETAKPKDEGGGGMGGNAEKSDTVVTIEVTPEQAELVILAAREGKVDLMLRNATDGDDITTPGATPNRLLAAGSSAAAPAENEEQPRRRAAGRAAAKAAPAAQKIETFHAR
jgi:pilus assembly protein CpaB